MRASDRTVRAKGTERLLHEQAFLSAYNEAYYGQSNYPAFNSAFGGDDNIEHVEACITRLRVTVKDLNKVDSEALQNEGALGVIIIGQQVHAIFGRQSDALRQLLDEHFNQ